jgi:hypothetical protein
MAESLIPEVIPGLVQVKEKKTGAFKTVYPIDAKELLMSGDFELVENGAVEAARINANPLRQFGINPKIVVAEVTGIAGQAHVASDEKGAEKLIKASDHGGKEVTQKVMDTPTAEAETVRTGVMPAKAAGTPTGAKSDTDKR